MNPLARLNPLTNMVACPYCYHRIDARRLWYQCNGRGSPGKEGCKPVNDPDRVRETGIDEAARPVFSPLGKTSPAQALCPTCGAETGKRVCPCCHTVLSANFGSAPSPLIAVVGATGTGKTVYLNVLAHELTAGLRRRFGADVRLSDSSSDVDINQVYVNSTLYAQTSQAKDGRRAPVVFEWRYPHRMAAGLSRLRTVFLSFYDTAGEDLSRQGFTDDLAYLGAADALIVLLDPFMIPQARDQISLPDQAVRSSDKTVNVINRVTEALRIAHSVKSHKTVRIPVAVTFAKIDAFFDLLGPDHPLARRPAEPQPPAYDETAGRMIHENVRALLHEWEADDIDAHMRFNYGNFRYFAVSSLGAEPDYLARTIDRRGIRPFRVDEPLVWLMSLLGVVDRQEMR